MGIAISSTLTASDMSSHLRTRFWLLLSALATLTHCLTLENLPLEQELPDGGKIWVVLVAGSNGYYNYRHQADVCHSYQVVHKHGIPDERIIVMMYDDIALNKENPKKGKIFNRPNGTDVYHGVPKDYTGKQVSNQTFVDVLLGKKIHFGSGKTLQSGPKDHVLVYFSDHGGVGLVAFPSTLLHATTLVDTLKTMNKKKKYGKMTLYIEACESGSMFKGLLPDNINIYATTASNGTTSSYAYYYDDELKTFLGDVYSVKWLEDSDRENLNRETLEKQYKIVKRETNTSTVCQFGDLSISKMKVSQFQGGSGFDQPILTDFSGTIENPLNYFYNHSPFPPSLHRCGRDAVPGPEVPKVILEKRLASNDNDEDKTEIQKALEKMVQGRKSLVKITKDIINLVTSDEDETEKIMNTKSELKTQFACHKNSVEVFHDNCFNLGCNGYAIRQANHFATLCEMGYNQIEITNAMKKVCSSHQQNICGLH